MSCLTRKCNKLIIFCFTIWKWMVVFNTSFYFYFMHLVFFNTLFVFDKCQRLFWTEIITNKKIKVRIDLLKFNKVHFIFFCHWKIMTNFTFLFLIITYRPKFSCRDLNVLYFCKQYIWQSVRQLDCHVYLVTSQK